MLSIHMTQPLVGEYMLSYERSLSRRLSIEYSLGLRIGDVAVLNFRAGRHPLSDDLYKSDVIVYSTLNKDISSAYYSNSFKMFFNRKRGNSDSYFNIEPFFRFSWGEFSRARTYRHPSDGKEIVYNHDLEQKISEAGIKLLIGQHYRPIKLSSQAAIVFNIFYGIGFRYKFVTDTYFKLKEGQTPTFENQRDLEYTDQVLFNDRYYNFGLPSLHFGLKMGFAWRNTSVN